MAEGVHFIATEYVQGETLRQKMNDRPVDVRDALEMAIQLASALSAAHGVGIVHRDIKPENIMVRPDGYVKLLDFGLAKLMDRKDFLKGIEGPTLAPAGTQDGVVMGSIHYMSPEQARGMNVDA